MHTFLLDLWHDLRAKRLWPVAALLLVAMATVPFTLTKEEQPAPPPVVPPTQAQTASDKLPTIQLDDVSSKPSSNLSQFRQRNPFRPLRDLPKKAADTGDGENKTIDLGKSPGRDAGSGGSSGGDDKASAAGSGGKSGGGTAGSTGAASGGSTGGGSGGSTGGSSGGSTGGGTRTIYYDYRTDLEFGLSGKKRKAMKQVAAFTLLGEKKEPAAMFLGVTDDHDWAVFTVDTARYQAQGEHECKPTPQRCEFIYLKVADNGNETKLTTLDGEKSYDLELTAIKRIILDKSSVEDVPTEEQSDSAAAEKRNTVDSEPRSLFDILAKRF